MAETDQKRMWMFKYERPETLDRPKRGIDLVNTDILRVAVQVVQKDGGETNMHAHPALDSTWLVLAGRARFYGYGDVVVGEAGKYEGVVIPQGVPYWFEAVSEEPLEILHITALHEASQNERVNYAPRVQRPDLMGRGRAPTEEEQQAAAASAPRP